LTPVKGQNIVLYATVDGGDFPFACGRSCSFSHQNNLLEVTNYNSANAKEFKYNDYTWSIQADGLIGLDSNLFTYGNILEYAKSQTPISVKFSVDLGAAGYDNYVGTCLIASCELQGNVKEIATYSIQLQGSGAYTVTSGITPGVGGAIVGVYTATGGETTFSPTYTPSWVSGSLVYYVSRGGIQVENINDTGTPNNNDVVYNPTSGSITVSTDSPLGPTEFIRVIAQQP